MVFALSAESAGAFAMSLKEYVRKRDFRKTAEPKASRPGKSGHRFVIQKHAATRLHYDFRLELGGTLKSWAVPKGVPYKKGERRLAVHVEDHPVSYIDFEGTIPKGQYGGGTVMVWDAGTFEPLSDAPLKELEGGKLHFVLHGKKLEGEWYLVRLRGGDEWLLIKGGEDMQPVSAKAEDTSVLSKKSMKQLSEGAGRVWQSNRVDAKNSFRARIAEAAHKQEAKEKNSSKIANGAVAPVGAPLRGVRSRSKKKIVQRGHLGKASLPAKSKSKLTPEFIEPMKAQLVAAPPPGEWIYEIKFDGFRAMAYRDRRGTRLLSRNDKNFAAKFPDVVKAVDALDVADAVIDGEIVALDEKGRSSFQLLQAYEMGEKRPPLFFYAFDLLQLNGRDLLSEPLHARKAELEKLLSGEKGLIRYSASLGNEPKALLEQARKLGLEGLIGKRPDSAYEAGRRSGAWIKLKLHREQEFVIGGYTPPGGSRPHFGALLVGVYEIGGRSLLAGDAARSKGKHRLQAGSYDDEPRRLVFAGKVGTGFNAKLLRSLHQQFQKIAASECPFSDLPQPRDGRYGQRITAAEMRRCHWVKPVLVAQIKFAEWTRDQRLRQPVFLGLREDKEATEVVRED